MDYHPDHVVLKILPDCTSSTLNKSVGAGFARASPLEMRGGHGALSDSGSVDVVSQSRQ